MTSAGSELEEEDWGKGLSVMEGKSSSTFSRSYCLSLLISALRSCIFDRIWIDSLSRFSLWPSRPSLSLKKKLTIRSFSSFSMPRDASRRPDSRSPTLPKSRVRSDLSCPSVSWILLLRAYVSVRWEQSDSAKAI